MSTDATPDLCLAAADGVAADLGTPRWVEWINDALEWINDAFARLGRWLTEHSDEIQTAIAAIAVAPTLKRGLERASADGYVPVVNLVGDGGGLEVLIALAEDKDEPAVLALVERVVRDESRVEALTRRLRVLPPGPHIIQLEDALEHFHAGEDESAVALFLVGMEGAFRGIAREEGISNQRSAERTIRALGLYDHELGVMFRRLVYGGAGNPYRHGAALDGHRTRAIACVCALEALCAHVEYRAEWLRLEAMRSQWLALRVAASARHA